MKDSLRTEPPVSRMDPPTRRWPERRRWSGAEEIGAAFDRGAAIQIVLAPRSGLSSDDAALVERARALGIEVRLTSERERLRLTDGRQAETLLALEGPSPRPTLDELMDRGGLVLVLVGVRYPGNVGFIVRAAEVAGATGIVLAETWTRSERASAMRFAMQADRYFPVIDAEVGDAVASARRAGRRLFALETEGEPTPWDAALEGSLALFLGGEAEGIPAAIVAQMDACLRIPMRGFIPSYNVQAAAGIVLGEWLRRMHVRVPDPVNPPGR